MDEPKDVAGVIAPPPLIFAGGLATGLILNRLLRAPSLPVPLARVAGGAALVAAGAFGPPAFAEMMRQKTHIDPYHPTSSIVETGPFAYSRNPLYLSMTLLYLGITLLARATLPLVLLPGILLGVRRGVIDREEAYLERKFGETYLSYKARVRRWI